MKSSAKSEKTHPVILELTRTGQLTLINDLFEKLSGKVSIGIINQIEFEGDIEILLRSLDEQDSIKHHEKKRYRARITNLFKKNRKYKLDRQTRNEFEKFIELRNAIEDLENKKIEYNDRCIKYHRSQIEKLIRLYQKKTTRFDDIRELKQIFSIITKAIIFELSPGYDKNFELFDTLENIVSYYLNLIDSIYFDEAMEKQLLKLIEKFYSDIVLYVGHEDLYRAAKLDITE